MVQPIVQNKKQKMQPTKVTTPSNKRFNSFSKAGSSLALRTAVAPSYRDTLQYHPQEKVLYRSWLNSVTAVSQKPDAEQKRFQTRKTTGWRSKLTAPYRCLGTPDLELEKPTKKTIAPDGSVKVEIVSASTRKKVDTGKSGEGRVVLGEAWTSEQSKVSRLKDTLGTQRAEAIQSWMKQHPGWVDHQDAAAEPPYVNRDYDDTKLQYLQCIHHGLGYSRSGLQELRTDVQNAELRLRRCRAGNLMMNLTNDEEAATEQMFQQANPHVVGQTTKHPNTQTATMSTTNEEVGATSSETQKIVPKLPLAEMLTSIQQHHRQGPSTLPSRKLLSGETNPGEFGAISLNRAMTKNERIRVILGHSSIAHPARDLGRLCTEFEKSLACVNSRLQDDLKRKSIDRDEVLRRKFRAFRTANTYFNATDQLECMRLEADKERLQTAVRLFQNRQWYTKLLQIVVTDDTVNEDEQFILSKIKRILEEGGVFTKDTIRQLVLLYKTDPKRTSTFDSLEVQNIFEFLCEQFDVHLQEYDKWIREANLPIPAKTSTRTEQARQRRVEFFDNEVVARHWFDKFEILQKTKAIHDWFPEEVVATIEHRVTHPTPPPTSRDAGSFSRKITPNPPSRNSIHNDNEKNNEDRPVTSTTRASTSR